jgi:hypothetical protein
MISRPDECFTLINYKRCVSKGFFSPLARINSLLRQAFLHAAATFIGRVTQFATTAITPTTSITGQKAA